MPDCHPLCRSVTYSAGLLPTVQSCYLQCRPVTLLIDLFLSIPADQLPSVQFFVPSFQVCSFLWPPVIVCVGLLPTLLSLRILVCCLPLMQTCLPSVRTFLSVSANSLPSVQACQWFLLWITLDYVENINCWKLNLRSSYWMNFLSFKLMWSNN